MTPGKVVVIGAGVVGASCAYELSLRGWNVELIDRSGVGAGCSRGNCGYVCPSHVFPLAKPGAIRSTLPLLFRSNSPFAVRPRFDLHLLAWFARFAASCRPELVEQTSHALHALLQSGKLRYEEIIAAEHIECEHEPKGCLFIYNDVHHLDAFNAENETIRARFGFGARRIGGDELAAMEPTLRPDLAGAWFFECDGHLRPDRYMSGLRNVLLARGVTLRESCELIDLAPGAAGRAARAVTNQGEIEADAFVIATGAWTPNLSNLIGVRPPIVPGKGYSVTLANPPFRPERSMVFESHRVAVTPFHTGLRIGSTMEFAGYDDSIRRERLQLLTDSASLYFRQPIPPTAEGAWFGWRPMVPDGRPFIDVVPRWNNVWLAAGHSMIGMSTGPATGRLVAELVGGETPHIDPAPFRLGRGV